MCSCRGIPCSLTAGPLVHNWLGSCSISASRPSLMLPSPALPSSRCPCIIPPFLSPSLHLFFLVCLFAFFFFNLHFPPVSAPFSYTCLSALHRPHCQDTLQERRRERKKKISGIILIQTDIKRHRARKRFLCRLIISPCFSALFTFCLLVTSISSLEGSSGLCSPGLSEHSLDAAFEATQIWQKKNNREAPHFSHISPSLSLSFFSQNIRLCDTFPACWHAKALRRRHREQP